MYWFIFILKYFNNIVKWCKEVGIFVVFCNFMYIDVKCIIFFVEVDEFKLYKL